MTRRELAMKLKDEGKSLSEIGSVLGVSKERARQLSTPGWKRKSRSKGIRVVRPWSEEEEKLLGTSVDWVVAKKLNRSLYCVKRRRDLLGIPPYRKHFRMAEQNVASVRP